MKDCIVKFWSKVNKNGPLKANMESQCWEWIAAKDRDGYGLYRNVKMVKAHRFSWELYFGPITNNLLCLHKCDFPSCVNPYHLFLGTHHDNVQDKVSKNRQKAAVHVGTLNTNVKLQESDVLKIRNDNREAKVIAEQYGVSRTQIYRIKNRKLWKHL